MKTRAKTKKTLAAFLASLLTMMSIVICFAGMASAAETDGIEYDIPFDWDEEEEIENVGVGAYETAYDNLTVSDANGTVYTIFASNSTGTPNKYSSSQNYDETSFNNNGYDLYASFSNNPLIRLGASFTVEDPITEISRLSIRAYDTDEESGERDYIRLVDETDGTEEYLGYLSGWDETWNTTVFDIDPSLLKTGHTYHFTLEEYVSGWVVWVRNVTLEIGGYTPGEDALQAKYKENTCSIDINGHVKGTVIAWDIDREYDVEFKCSETDSKYQYGYLMSYMNVTKNASELDFAFDLASNAPNGIYKLDAIFMKKGTGIVEKTLTTYLGYGYSSVTYDANGGTNNVPTDTNRYAMGDEVTVLFNNIPTKADSTFLGWARSATAKKAEFTQNGNKKFNIGNSDVVLYAVWDGEGEDTPTYIIITPDCPTPPCNPKPCCNNDDLFMPKKGTECESHVDTGVEDLPLALCALAGSVLVLGFAYRVKKTGEK